MTSRQAETNKGTGFNPENNLAINSIKGTNTYNKFESQHTGIG
jgi:hypothetical protein